MSPDVNYVVNNQGKPIFVQLSVQEWERFFDEYQRLKTLFIFKERLTTAFKEIRQIQNGQKQGTSLEDFLNKI
jgi:Fe-S cluster biosynthesis and repair protein YggX